LAGTPKDGFDQGCGSFDIGAEHHHIAGFQTGVFCKELQQAIAQDLDLAQKAVGTMEFDRAVFPGHRGALGEGGGGSRQVGLRVTGPEKVGLEVV
jgi:hypothetical protein